jgi:hypothetical protein
MTAIPLELARNVGRARVAVRSGRRIMFVQAAADVSGSMISGQLITKGLSREGWRVDAAFSADGPGLVHYKSAGCSVHRSCSPAQELAQVQGCAEGRQSDGGGIGGGGTLREVDE